MRFFDCNIRMGFERVPVFTFSETAEHLINEMDHYGIEKALVHHSYAKFFNAEQGNERLSDEIEKFKDRLYPLYAYPANINLKTSKPTEFLELIEQKQVKGVLFTPVSGRYEFHTGLFREAFGMLNAVRMPVFLEYEGKSPFEYLVDYRQMDDFLSRYRKAPLVLLSTGYRFDAELYSLADQYSNLYLEISGYQSNCAIENFCERFGSGRLLFGSRYPRLSPGASKYKIENAFLEQGDKENIAYNNLTGIIEGIGSI